MRIGERINKTGKPIAMQCYSCATRTLVYNETSRKWHCWSCHASLTTDEAVNAIASSLGRSYEEQNRDTGYGNPAHSGQTSGVRCLESARLVVARRHDWTESLGKR